MYRFTQEPARPTAFPRVHVMVSLLAFLFAMAACMGMSADSPSMIARFPWATAADSVTKEHVDIGATAAVWQRENGQPSAAPFQPCAESASDTFWLACMGCFMTLFSLYPTLLRCFEGGEVMRSSSIMSTTASVVALLLSAANFAHGCQSPATGVLENVAFGFGWQLLCLAAFMQMFVLQAHVSHRGVATEERLSAPLLPVHHQPKFQVQPSAVPTHARRVPRLYADISAAQVKELRNASGAGMMKCKEALKECNGDMKAAQEWLRAKGIAGADKKAGRSTGEGLITSYIHTGSRLGVMVEVNCETDFVSKGEVFQQLCTDIAMQVAALPEVQYVKFEDIPEDVRVAEKEAQMRSEDLASKPEAIREKIVEGRMGKVLNRLALMETEFVKESGVTMSDLVKTHIAKLGENIQICRFVRFNLGETAKDGESSEE